MYISYYFDLTCLETRTKGVQYKCEIFKIKLFSLYVMRVVFILIVNYLLRIVCFPLYKHLYQDPKDGELYLCRVKSGEILVEARNDTDVQIVHWIRVQGRKTNRIIQQLVAFEVSLRIARDSKKLHEVKLIIRVQGIE